MNKTVYKTAATTFLFLTTSFAMAQKQQPRLVQELAGEKTMYTMPSAGDGQSTERYDQNGKTFFISGTGAVSNGFYAKDYDENKFGLTRKKVNEIDEFDFAAKILTISVKDKNGTWTSNKYQLPNIETDRLGEIKRDNMMTGSYSARSQQPDFSIDDKSDLPNGVKYLGTIQNSNPWADLALKP